MTLSFCSINESLMKWILKYSLFLCFLEYLLKTDIVSSLRFFKSLLIKSCRSGNFFCSKYLLGDSAANYRYLDFLTLPISFLSGLVFLTCQLFHPNLSICSSKLFIILSYYLFNSFRISSGVTIFLTIIVFFIVLFSVKNLGKGYKFY